MRWISICLLFFATFAEAQRITVIGVGRLGLCLALCLERAGYEVLGVDLSPQYIRQLNRKTLDSPEPFVTDLLLASQNFFATSSLDEGLDFSDLYFIVVPTNPHSVAGEYNCKALDSLLSSINERAVENKHIAIVSTVSPAYIRNIAAPLVRDCPGAILSYNPDFIAQGEIIRGLLKPDIILIGEGSEEKGDELETIFRNVCENEPYFARMSPESAEIMKLGLNCFVTMKVAYANLIGDIADSTEGADKKAILRAIGMDRRIGGKCLMPGYGYGGPCFPRDNRALGDYAKQIGLDSLLFRATDRTNQAHADFLARQFLELGLDEYLFEDVCYKPNCAVPIIEESHKLLVAKKVAEAGRIVVIKDRSEVIAQLKAQYGDLFDYIEENW